MPVRLGPPPLSSAPAARPALPRPPVSRAGGVGARSGGGRGWFRRGVAGFNRPYRYGNEEDPDAEFDHLADADVQQELATFRSECLAADEAVRAMSLDDTFTGRNGPISLRWTYVHMIEEYARHNGHADLLRECIDGATGD